MKLIMLGAPGAGKGTQAKLISEKLNIPAISTGAIIREAIEEGTEFGKQAKAYIVRGDLLPDEMVIGLVTERVKAEPPITNSNRLFSPSFAAEKRPQCQYDFLHKYCRLLFRNTSAF